MLNLKVCPFCGGEAELSKDEYGRYTVFCTGEQCGAVMVGFKTRQIVIDSWNERVDKLPAPVILPSNKPTEANSKYHDVCTVHEMAERLKAENMPIAEYTIRRLVKTGQLPSVKVGQKTLITYHNMLSFIQNGNFVEPYPSVKGKIRPVKP